ncbi:hypothetical protein NIES4102_41670 (plasmid) [Chondrocystis sp. NIES-4102]|nr:hypothetical protein NIES4102_41670 [Chondrocystis sp. NIES-4102]
MFKNIIKYVSPQAIIFAFYSLSAWFVFSSLGELAAIWSQVFSNEKVMNIW